MSDLVQDSGIRWLRWALTIVVGIALTVVVVRVSRCLGDNLCTFAPGALQSAVMAFVGGPVVVATAWIMPVVLRHRATASWVGAGFMALAVVAVVVGVFTLDGGGPGAAVLPSLAPAFGLAGLMVIAAPGDQPS